MSIDLYTYNSICCSRITTHNYSTSFSLGIRLLHPKFHDAIYAIYGFVRFADEIVDTFHSKPQQQLLEQFREETFQAISRRFSTNPVLHSFQWMVNTYSVSHDLIEAFLYSMKLDLTINKHTQQSYEQYIYGSAEVVGLMCLYVFCSERKDLYEKLYHSARRLGAAFQKVNFLRDLQSDYIDRGRIYFPGIDYSNFTSGNKRAIEESIAADFAEARKGIMMLPHSSRLGVFTAYNYYLVLFRKIRGLTPGQLMAARHRISNLRKLWIMMVSFLQINTGLFRLYASR